MTSFRQPDYLTDRDAPTNRIRCPIHGFIHFSDNERRIIDHPLFRRLRYIRQLALTELVYPGATHTRFEHSLGVMEVATLAFQSLRAKHGELMEETFKTVEGFEDNTMAKVLQVLRLAALLHDIGHAPFCHSAEEVIFKDLDFKHEGLAVKILREGDLGQLVDDLYWGGCAELVALMIDATTEREVPPQFKVLQDLVSGEMDADRMDYLLRDSYHCGVEYGRFDHRRMIECLEVRRAENDAIEIAIHRDGLHTFEALILARYQISVQVYYHRLRRIYDKYLTQYFLACESDLFESGEEILAHNDITMMTRIMKDAQAAEGDRGKWASRICGRSHHRMVFETPPKADVMSIRHTKAILQALEEEYPDCKFLDDYVDGRIHKQYVPGTLEDRGLSILMAVEPGESPVPIGEASHIISVVPHRFLCGRVFADLAGDETELRDEIRAFAEKEWRDRGGRP